jgi:hypothetical protein
MPEDKTLNIHHCENLKSCYNNNNNNSIDTNESHHLEDGKSRTYTVCPGSVRTVFVKNTRRELFPKCQSFYSK